MVHAVYLYPLWNDQNYLMIHISVIKFNVHASIILLHILQSAHLLTGI